VHVKALVIGGGLSGLAAAIRLARFDDGVLLLEKHSRPGGLNSYYYRNNRLIETGLHAITNYAAKTDKKAPLNRLLRQLKIKRHSIGFQQQIRSEICFQGQESLFFSNDFEEFLDEIHAKFHQEAQSFARLVRYIDSINPFTLSPFLSARQIISGFIGNPLLVDMLLCPLFYYGSSWEDDMDFKQFVIMFRSIYQEGMFRPAGTIKDLLDYLVSHLQNLGGSIRYQAGVKRIITKNNTATGVLLADGEEITCDFLISTIGSDETTDILGAEKKQPTGRRLGFVENIFLTKSQEQNLLPSDKTIIFFNTANTFRFQKPTNHVDLTSGVICLPYNFYNRPADNDFIEVRTTHLANYSLWNKVSDDKTAYISLKKEIAALSCAQAESIIGQFSPGIIFQDSFTPLTIKRFTGKIEGAIYGSPNKVNDGDIGFDNLFLAGTDQGFLGIVGAMLSGVSIVNMHILPKI
jgi:phytoene dehydrogenase-like protein